VQITGRFGFAHVNRRHFSIREGRARRRNRHRARHRSPAGCCHSFSKSGRPITEILREAKERNSTATLDADFGNDLEEIIAAQQLPRNPPSWD
jgi:hypothetical protein